MNKQIITFIKHTGFAVFANLSRIVTTLILTLVLPKVMSVEAYSNWQLYLFYATYLLYSSFGWCEGLYIEYGGRDYCSLNRKLISSQIWGIAVYELVVCVILIFLILPLFNVEGTKRELLIGAAVYMVLNVTRYQIQTVLQATNRISEYARVYSGERFLFFCMAMCCAFVGSPRYTHLIGMEIFSNLLMMVYAAFLCRDIIFERPCGIRDSTLEARRLIRSGYSISLAGLIGQLIIGVVRFSIERKFGTVTFGKISLSFSMANMLVTCISAVSIVVFPALKRLDRKLAETVFLPVRRLMTVPMFGVLLCYVPMNTLLSLWLPRYKDSLKYLAILLPLCIYEVRNMALVWTYLKAWGGQNYIMYANLCTLAVSVVTTICTVYLIGNVDLAAASIMGLYALKSILTERMLKRYIHTEKTSGICKELMLTAVFIWLSWNCSSFTAFAGYLACYIIYVITEMSRMREAWQSMKGVILD